MHSAKLVEIKHVLKLTRVSGVYCDHYGHCDHGGDHDDEHGDEHGDGGDYGDGCGDYDFDGCGYGYDG